MMQIIFEGQIQKQEVIDQNVDDILPKIVYDSETPHDDSLEMFHDLGMGK